MDAIQECLKCVEREPTSAGYTKESVTAAIKGAELLRGSLLGFERDAEAQLDRHIASLERKKQALSNGMANYRKFATLDMLRWRSNGMPRLVLFSPNSPDFAFVSRWNTAEIRPGLPGGLEACYEDVCRKVARKTGTAFWKTSSVTVSCSYTGVVPDETRKKIETAQKQFANVFIMAEATKWTTTEERQPILADPLVVGWDGADLWLIDQFDLTPIEKLIASEYTI